MGFSQGQGVCTADVQRDAAFAGAIVMDFQLMPAEKSGHLADDEGDGFLKFVIWPLTQQRVQVALQCFDACAKDQNRHCEAQ